jgi:hypothetical protein
MRLQQMLLARSRPRHQTLYWRGFVTDALGLALRPAVVASLLAVVLLETAALLALLPSVAPQRFITASGPEHAGARAVVLFRPETTLLQMRTVLAAEQATIVRGPTPDGSVVVQWLGLPTDAVDGAIDRLRAQSDYVLRAERGS